MTYHQLQNLFAQLPSIDLKGMILLREVRPPCGQFFPVGVPREVIVEAVTEITAYTGRCQYAMEQLSKLAPVPLTTINILEYGI